MGLRTTTLAAATLALLALTAPAAAQATPAPTGTVHVAAAAAGSGSANSYTLFPSPQGGPLRWNPCLPIFYRVNLTLAPPGALADVKSAVAQVSSALGIRFVYEGTTPVIPQVGYGYNRVPAPPLVIAWAKPGRGGQAHGQSDMLPAHSTIVGEGGYTLWGGRDSNGDHKLRITSGYVVLKAGAPMLPGFVPGQSSRGALLLHELGHAVGLDHTSDPTQIMYPSTGGASAYGAGDRAGLRLVGAPAGCLN